MYFNIKYNIFSTIIAGYSRFYKKKRGSRRVERGLGGPLRALGDVVETRDFGVFGGVFVHLEALFCTVFSLK